MADKFDKGDKSQAFNDEAIRYVRDYALDVGDHAVVKAMGKYLGDRRTPLDFAKELSDPVKRKQTIAALQKAGAKL